MSDSGMPRGSPGPVRADSSVSAAQRGGPYLLLLPLLLALAAVWWIRQPGSSGVPSRPPERADPETSHEVLGGEMLLHGATLAFWLAPSEPDAARQVFQAKALRRRYGLADGEPWRLRLEWRAPAAAVALALDPALDLSELCIEDESGRALAALRLDRELDPLATLLEAPAQPLRVGTSLDMVLWGRAPLANARLVGRSRTAADEELPFEVALSSRARRIGDLASPMARLDPPPAVANPPTDGKTAPAGASAPPVRGTHDARY